MEVKSLEIMGKKYKVKLMPKQLQENYLGLCKDDTAEIFMNRGLREGEEYWTTLFHEFGHGVMYRNGVRFSGTLPIEMEEIIVETFSHAFYGLVKKILKGLQDGEGYIFPDEVASFCKDIK